MPNSGQYVITISISARENSESDLADWRSIAAHSKPLIANVAEIMDMNEKEYATFIKEEIAFLVLHAEAHIRKHLLKDLVERTKDEPKGT